MLGLVCLAATGLVLIGAVGSSTYYLFVS